MDYFAIVVETPLMEIKKRFGLKSIKVEAKTLREAVEIRKADLRGANLGGADLRETTLCDTKFEKTK